MLAKSSTSERSPPVVHEVLRDHAKKGVHNLSKRKNQSLLGQLVGPPKILMLEKETINDWGGDGDCLLRSVMATRDGDKCHKLRKQLAVFLSIAGVEAKNNLMFDNGFDGPGKGTRGRSISKRYTFLTTYHLPFLSTLIGIPINLWQQGDRDDSGEGYLGCTPDNFFPNEKDRPTESRSIHSACPSSCCPSVQYNSWNEIGWPSLFTALPEGNRSDTDESDHISETSAEWSTNEGEKIQAVNADIGSRRKRTKEEKLRDMNKKVLRNLKDFPRWQFSRCVNIVIMRDGLRGTHFVEVRSKRNVVQNRRFVLRRSTFLSAWLGDCRAYFDDMNARMREEGYDYTDIHLQSLQIISFIVWDFDKPAVLQMVKERKQENIELGKFIENQIRLLMRLFDVYNLKSRAEEKLEGKVSPDLVRKLQKHKGDVKDYKQKRKEARTERKTERDSRSKYSSKRRRL